MACDELGKSRGHGLVHVETEEASTLAIDRGNGMQIGEATAEATQFLKRGERDVPKENYTNLHSKNGPPSFC